MEALEQLHDIHEPSASLLHSPLAWVLAAIVCTLIVSIWRCRAGRSAPRRAALRGLELIAEKAATTQQSALLADVNLVLRRFALIHFPTASIASLHGAPWLEFLDHNGGDQRFGRGPGAVLGWGPYTRPTTMSQDAESVIELARDWVRGAGDERALSLSDFVTSPPKQALNTLLRRAVRIVHALREDQRMRAVCGSSDNAAIRRALLTWVGECSGLDELARRYEDPDFSRLLRKLDTSLYSKAEDFVDGREIWRHLRRLRRQPIQDQLVDSGLPSLYSRRGSF